MFSSGETPFLRVSFALHFDFHLRCCFPLFVVVIIVALLAGFTKVLAMLLVMEDSTIVMMVFPVSEAMMPLLLGL